MAEKDDVRNQIIGAARKRFSHFGYAKTTMAEVAADCSMSPGNLYRFFPGKLDIAEAIVTTDVQAYQADLRRVATAPNRSPRERLHDVLLKELQQAYTRLQNDPRAYEMASVISNERPEFAQWILANERKILVEVLEDAERHGEFVVANKELTAEVIQSATLKFRYPQMWSKMTLPALERELEGVLNLIIDGLRPDRATRPAVPHVSAA
jgi:AcrR family transcriptional regulator